MKCECGNNEAMFFRRSGHKLQRAGIYQQYQCKLCGRTLVDKENPIEVFQNKKGGLNANGIPATPTE